MKKSCRGAEGPLIFWQSFQLASTRQLVGRTSALHGANMIMRRALRQAMLLSALIFLPIPYGVAARRPSHPDAVDVLTQLNFASFSGSRQNSIQAIATDSSGNIFVAGTTTSPDLPVKNAAQPIF